MKLPVRASAPVWFGALSHVRPVDLSELTSEAQLSSHTGHVARARPPWVAGGLCIQQHAENISVVIESSAGAAAVDLQAGTGGFVALSRYVLCTYVLPVLRIRCRQWSR